MGAKNSESCLIKVQCVCESNEAMLVSTFEHQLSVSHTKISMSVQSNL